MYDAMEGATVIVCDTLTQIGPQCVTMITSHLVQVYIASSIHVGLKKNNNNCTLHYNLSTVLLSIYSPLRDKPNSKASSPLT